MVLSPKILFTSSDSLYILCPHTQKPLWANMYWRQKFFKVWFHLKQLVYTVATHTHTKKITNANSFSKQNDFSTWHGCKRHRICLSLIPTPQAYQTHISRKLRGGNTSVFYGWGGSNLRSRREFLREIPHPMPGSFPKNMRPSIRDY